MASFVIGTRGSSLALCQTQIVQARLEERFPRHRFTLQAITAQADRRPDVPLVALGGEGIFVKELETALQRGRIDLAVHSLKDLPLDLPPSLRIAAVLARDEPRDAFISRSGDGVDAVPAGSRVGTSSLRRRSQLLHRRRDLSLLEIRGNVDTRLRRLDEGQYDAIIVAACGLIRLGLEARITELLDCSVMLPEPGQGAIAVEARADHAAACELVNALEDPISRACVEAERAFLRALGGGCRVPIAAYAQEDHGELALEGAVVAEDGAKKLTQALRGPMTEPITLGRRLAQTLIAAGARDLLQQKVSGTFQSGKGV